MIHKLDVFRLENSGVLWLESAATLAYAKARIQEIAACSPGGYLILDQVTGNKHFIGPEGVEGRSVVDERKLVTEGGTP
jgi:hypothetical protein